MAQRKSRRRPGARLLSSGELAGLCGLSKRTIVKAIAAGKIRAARTVGGHYRVSLAEAKRFMRGRGMDISHLEARENCALVLARDRFVGDLLSDVLGRAGVEVLQSKCLFEAGVLAERHHPWLVIIDADSAPPDPAAICRSVTSGDICPGTAVMVLARDVYEKEKFRRAGADAVLVKPFSVKQLREKLRDLGFSTGSFRRVGK